MIMNITKKDILIFNNKNKLKHDLFLIGEKNRIKKRLSDEKIEELKILLENIGKLKIKLDSIKQNEPIYKELLSSYKVLKKTLRSGHLFQLDYQMTNWLLFEDAVQRYGNRKRKIDRF